MFEKDLIRQLGLKNNGEGKLSAQQRLVAALETMAVRHPEQTASLIADIKEYTTWLEQYRLCDRTVRQPYSPAMLLWNGLLLIAGFPVWMAGMLFNYPPYKLAERLSLLPKDPQFISSVHYVGGLVFFPLYHLILAVLSFIFIPGLLWKICLILLLIPTGLFAYGWCLSFQSLAENIRFRRQPKDRTVRMIELRRKIFEKIWLVCFA
jgi:hypothetical protein